MKDKENKTNIERLLVYIEGFKIFLRVNELIRITDSIPIEKKYDISLRIFISFIQNNQVSSKNLTLAEHFVNKFTRNKGSVLQSKLLVRLHLYSSSQKKKELLSKLYQDLQKSIANAHDPVNKLWIYSEFINTGKDIFKDKNGIQFIKNYLQKIVREEVLTLEGEIKNTALFTKEMQKIKHSVDIQVNPTKTNQKESPSGDMSLPDVYEIYNKFIINLPDASPDIQISTIQLLIDQVSNLFKLPQQKKLQLTISAIQETIGIIKPGDKYLLYFLMGFTSWTNISKSFRDNIMVQFGRIHHKQIIIPNFTDLSIYLKSEHSTDRSTMSESTVANMVRKVVTRTQKPTWKYLLTDLEFSSTNPGPYISVILYYFLLIRASKRDPNTISGREDIETISRRFSKILQKLSSNADFIKDWSWFQYSLTSVMPSNQNLITKYRTAAWNWYKTTAEIFTHNQIGDYHGPEETLLFHLHDSPSHYNLKIMKAYNNYIVDNKQQSHRKLNSLIARYNIYFPADYNKSLGENIEKVRNCSGNLLESLENLYGTNISSLIFENLLNNQIPVSIRKKAIKLISDLTLRNTKFIREIRIPVNTRIKIFEPIELPVEKSIQILDQIRALIQSIDHQIHTEQTSESALSLFKANNLLFLLLYKFLSQMKDHTENLTLHQQHQVVTYSLFSVLPLLPREGKLILTRLLSESQISKSNLLRMKFLCIRADRILGLNVEKYSKIMNPHIPKNPRLSPEVSTEILPDIVRELPIHPLSLLLRNISLSISSKIGSSPQHVVNSGIATGQPIITNKDDLKNRRLNGNEIIITDKLDFSLRLPDVKGIITTTIYPSLSHLAITASENGIPWFTVNIEQFNQITKEIHNSQNPNLFYKMTSFSQQCRLDKIPVNKQIKENPTVEQPFDMKGSAIKYSPKKPSFGNKADGLFRIREVFPEHSLPFTCVPFSVFDKEIRQHTNIHKWLKDLHHTKTTSKKRTLLNLIQTQIENISLSPKTVSNIKKDIALQIPGPKQLIVRSSTNCEDLTHHYGAGIYKSIFSNGTEIDRSILHVYKSFYSEKAWNDRKSIKIDETRANMGLIIQKVVSTRYSFVLHSRSSNHGPNYSVIEIVPGLGESLVSGQNIYEGYPHQFSYYRKNGKITRHQYCTKNYQTTTYGVKPTDFKDDILSTDGQRLFQYLRSIFKQGIQLEKVASIPQDIEGVIVENKSGLHTYFVQTRSKPPTKHFSFSRKKLSSHKETEDPHIKNIIHRNVSPKSAYTLANVNIIDSWLEAFTKVVGPGHVIIMPYGSSSYMIKDNKVLWDRINDLDLSFYLLEIKTPYEAYKFKELIFPKITNKFKQICKKRGLIIKQEKLTEKILSAEKQESLYSESDSRNAYYREEITPSEFFSVIGLDLITYKDKGTKYLKAITNKFLDKYRIIDKKNVLYCLRKKDKSFYKYVVQASLIYAYLSKCKFIATTWRWDKAIEDAHKIFMNLDLAETQNSTKEFFDNTLSVCLDYSIIAYKTRSRYFNYDMLKTQYPDLQQFSTGGNLETITYTLTTEKTPKKNDIFIQSHIDTGAIVNIVSIILGCGDDKKYISKALTLLNNSEDIKIPVIKKTDFLERIGGHRSNELLLFHIIKNLIKPIKEKSMTESEALKYLKDQEVITNIIIIIKELITGKHKLLYKFTKSSIKQIRNEYRHMTQLKKDGRISHLYQYSKRGNVAWMKTNCRITDLSIKYLFLPKKTDIFIDVIYIYNKNNRLIGYKYKNVGTLPNSKANILGLKECLNTIELLIRDEVPGNGKNLWKTFANPHVMVEGPPASSKAHCSFISPRSLAYFIEIFLDFKKRNKKLNKIPIEMTDKDSKILGQNISHLFKRKNTRKILKQIAKDAQTILPRSSLLETFDKFSIKKERGGMEINTNTMKILPFEYYFSSGFVARGHQQYWDWTPKGYYYWMSYYGDPVAQRYFNKYLNQNKGHISHSDIYQSLTFTFDARRSIHVLTPGKKAVTDSTKDLLRLAKALNNQLIVKKCINILQLVDINYREAFATLNYLLETYLSEKHTTSILSDIKKRIYANNIFINSELINPS